MTKYIFVAAAASMALAFASAASAQTVTTGVVNLQGMVPAQCTVVTGGSGNSFGGTVNLGNLADGSGHLTAALQATTGDALGGIGGSAQNFQVSCTGANNTATISATPLALVGGPATPAAGYADSVSYTAYAAFTTTGAAVQIQNVANGTTSASSTAFQFANSGGSNIAITANSFTDGGTPSVTVLLAGAAYAGAITVKITPGV